MSPKATGLRLGWTVSQSSVSVTHDLVEDEMGTNEDGPRGS